MVATENMLITHSPLDEASFPVSSLPIKYAPKSQKRKRIRSVSFNSEVETITIPNRTELSAEELQTGYMSQEELRESRRQILKEIRSIEKKLAEQKNCDTEDIRGLESYITAAQIKRNQLRKKCVRGILFQQELGTIDEAWLSRGYLLISELAGDAAHHKALEDQQVVADMNTEVPSFCAPFPRVMVR